MLPYSRVRRLAATMLLAAAALPPRSRAQGTDDPAVAGHRLFMDGRYAEARALLRRAVDADARDWRSMFDLGRIGYLAHDPNEAARWLEAAVREAPSESAVHQWLARAYSAEVPAAGRFRQLVLASRIHDHLLRAVALDSTNGDAALDLVRFDLEAPGLAGGSRSRAAREAAALASRDAYHGHLARALVAGKNGDLAGAERELRDALAAAPDSATPYYQLGYLYQRQRRYDDAFRVHDALLARRPDELEAEFEIGRTAAFSGERLDRARAALEHFLRVSDGIGTPPVWEAHYWLGVIRDWGHDFAGARAEYLRALELRPDYRDARDKVDRLARDHPESVTTPAAAAPDRLASPR